MKATILTFLLAITAHFGVVAQHSVAREWNDALLFAIRNDLAKPTVHARNLFYHSMLMYDSWAVLDPIAETYYLGKTVGNTVCPFTGFPSTGIPDEVREEVISYASYRYLSYQFGNSPNWQVSQDYFDSLMVNLGYPVDSLSIDYSTGSPSAMGNYLGYLTLSLAINDGSNQILDYENQYYSPINADLNPVLPGNPNMSDPNFWQPLALLLFIDQAGNILTETPDFQGAEWGFVTPFALGASELSQFTNSDTTWNVYLDPGEPPYLLSDSSRVFNNAYYRWGFELVSKWSSHLDPKDSVLWDISPASIGNIQAYPDETDLAQMQGFYDQYAGGDASIGHSMNPSTGAAYTPNMVPRGDYARVLAEFWADGPDSETPPGHWFTLLNATSDHPLTTNQWNGTGPVLGNLEWDVKTYFALGGAMHDAAIAAWSVKGWYDYPRPISVLRWMADRGQCSDSTMMSFNNDGIQLDSGYIELVLPGDSLQGDSLQNIGKIKLLTWIGTDTTVSPDTTTFGVDWILAENWWPYQRPTFVTPPFAGYISGHSTFSSAAADVLSYVTGDPFFPGGMGEFQAPADSFLVFEQGPSVDVTLQWATYRDAADQCSLSRIWGGIHPPQDDIAGRKMGQVIGPKAITYAESFFNGITTEMPTSESFSALSIYPNIVSSGNVISIEGDLPISLLVYDTKGKVVMTETRASAFKAPETSGMYFVIAKMENGFARSRFTVK